MKIGIFGGSFNPIHNGHINIAKYMLKKLELDKLIIVPVGKPSHKHFKLVDSTLRLAMCKCAFENEDKIVVSDIEITNPNTSYTIDTLKKVIDLFGKNNKFYEIIGQDSADTFNSWKNYEEILVLSKVVVFKRGNLQTNPLISNKNIIYFDTPVYNISSTMIREKIKNDEDISEYIPKKVLEIITKYKLYK